MAANMLPRLTPRSARKLWIVKVADGKTHVVEFAVMNSETDFRKIIADLAVGGWTYSHEEPKTLPQCPIFTFEDAQKSLADYLSKKAKQPRAAE